MQPLNFVAIDCETATIKDQYICQIGIAQVVDSKIIEERMWYIQPPNNQYSEYLKKFHHIDPKLTEYAPTFKAIWPEIHQYLNNKVVVAHNAKSADIAYLTKEFERNNIDKPSFSCICTYQLAKQIGGAQSYTLIDQCQIYNIDCANHHNALSDATATAYLFLKLFNKFSFSSINDVPSFNYDAKYKLNTPITNVPHSRKANEVQYAAIEQQILSPFEIEYYSIYQGKKVIITGFREEYKPHLVNILNASGAIVLKGMPRKTIDVLLAGPSAGPKKIEMAQLLNIQIDHYQYSPILNIYERL